MGLKFAVPNRDNSLDSVYVIENTTKIFFFIMSEQEIHYIS